MIARGRVLDRGHDRLQLRLWFLEFVVKFDNLFQGRDLLFRLPRLVEKCEQLIRARHFFAAQLDRLGLLRRQMKKAVLLQRFRRRAPPAFPFRFVKQIADHHLADLLDGRGTANALENIAHDRRRIALQQFLYSREVRRFPRQKMFGRKRGQIIRCVSKLHRMRFFAGKIDDDLVEKQVPIGHPAESPAFMQTKIARLKLFELLSGPRCQFPGVEQFLQFRIH